jgi:SAM-dependent methyltransferase
VTGSPDTSPDASDATETRWDREGNSESHIAHFAGLAAAGEDLEGEARFIDAMAPRGATILDAGCGAGRVAAALTRMGHRALGVDRDARLVEAARAAHPDTAYAVRDLLEVTPRWLAAEGHPTAYDLVVLAGNVMVFLAPGTERAVLQRMRDLLRPGGRLVAGFATDREYTVRALDADAGSVGLRVEARFSTWHLDAWPSGHRDAGWAVTILRLP